MGYKEIVSLDADTTIALGGKNKKTGKDNPKQVEGFYLGTRQVESKKSKNGLASIHFFQTPKGVIGVWGKTDMDRKLGTATPGAMTLVKFEKMVPTPNGEMYKYSVAQDTDNMTEAPPQQSRASNNDAAEEYADDSSGDSQEEYSASDADAEEAAQEEALAAAELATARKAKVQALLNKKGGGATKN